MNGQKLQDRFYLGLGLSARHVGRSADAYRPIGPFNPLDKQNRYLRLPAAFVSAKGNEGRTNVYGEPLWHGIFDASYTRAGDYLILGTENFFIASQEPLLPVLCVKANRIVSIVRPHMHSSMVNTAYGGYISGDSAPLLEDWPVSVFGGNRSSASAIDLPTDQAVPNWNVLLPVVPGVILSPGDLINDDLGRTAVITGSELTYLGWRLSAKMATT